MDEDFIQEGFLRSCQILLQQAEQIEDESRKAKTSEISNTQQSTNSEVQSLSNFNSLNYRMEGDSYLESRKFKTIGNIDRTKLEEENTSKHISSPGNHSQVNALVSTADKNQTTTNLPKLCSTVRVSIVNEELKDICSVSRTGVSAVLPCVVKEEIKEEIPKGDNFDIVFESPPKGANSFDEIDNGYNAKETKSRSGEECIEHDQIKKEIIDNNEIDIIHLLNKDVNLNPEKIKIESNGHTERSEDLIKNQSQNCMILNKPNALDIEYGNNHKDQSRGSDTGNQSCIGNGNIGEIEIEMESSSQVHSDNNSGSESKRSKESELYTVKNISHLNKFIKMRKVDQLFTCNICKMEFNYLLCVQNHVRTHTGERPFRCDVCPKSFVTKSTLIEHNRMHRGERNYICHQCGASFRQPCKLKLHLKRHNGELDFKCDKCGRAFLRKDHYQKHVQTHGKDRPYVCKECGKSFRVNNYLKDHIRKNHSQGTYKCEKCDLVYTRKDNLERHMSRKHSLIVNEMFGFQMV